ncbi:MAG: DUF1998 domain-containing protein, partial [Paludibacteraceae bacterium]|nr:DUF1998 domain-containing protein [Paludibacteraceae bacterium]
KIVKNVDISVYGLNLNEDSTIWHINTNNGRFYTGNYYTENDPAGRNPNFMFYAENDNTIVPMNNGVSIALGSKKVTDMIKLTLKSSPTTLNLSLTDPNSNKSAIRAAFYSAAFLLQRALADKLDVQPEEIEICERVDENCDYPLIYLSDALPNGAGIVSYLYEDGKLEELINSIVNFDSFDVVKTSKDKSFMQSLIAHRDNCLTACQKCLMTYTNRGFHHILDWRLGVGILRLMLDENYDFGFTAEARDQYEELKDWGEILKASAAKLNISQDDSCYENGFYYKGDTIIYHPLWKRENVCATIFNCTENVKMYNTFKLLRSDLTSDTGLGRQNRFERENAQVSPTQDTSDSRVENVDTQENTNNPENPDASIDIVLG